jgi:flavin-dependent dehydrogenase
MFDVLVAGAGLAGLQVARLLAQRGLRVALIDRKASVADSVHTTGIFVRKTWEDFPLPAEQFGRPIRDVVLYSPARRPLALTAPRDEFRVGRMSWIYLYLLEHCTRAGVVWMPSTRLLRVEPSVAAPASGAGGRERPPLHSRSPVGEVGVIVQRGGRVERVPARFVIGADGPRSLVARELELDRNDEFLVGLEDVVPGETPAMHCFLDPLIAPGYIAWVVDDGEEKHVGVAGYRDRFDPAASLKRFRASLPSLGRTLERRGGLIPVGGILRRIACEHGLLVGDAAGAVSPLTAGGLDAAMRLSAFAAEVTAAYLDSGDRRALAAYDGRRFRARFLARRWMRRAMRVASSHALPMELACALLRATPLRALAAHVFFGRGSFPDLSPGLPSSAHPARSSPAGA